MLHDLRLALRASRRRPAFALLVAVLIALGVGANAAVWAVVDAVLLQPFPVRDQDRLVVVRHRDLVRDVPFVEMSYPDLLDYRRLTGTLADLAGMPAVDDTFNLTGDGPPEVVIGRKVSGNFFDVLGVRPALGRTFAEAERTKGGPAAAILSHGFWERRFGGDPAAVGRSIRLDGESVRIIGVMPPGFAYPGPVDLWLAFEPGLEGLAEERQAGWLLGIGRLADGVTDADVTAELNGILEGLLELHAPGSRAEVVLTPLVETVVGDSRPQVLAVAGAVSVLLLIAGANVAGLLLARAASRRREIATRLALGASRGRLARQLLLESLPLAVAGSLAGLVVAGWGLSALQSVAAGEVPRLGTASTTWPVAAFAVGLSVAVLAAASLAPIGEVRRLALHSPLRSSTGGEHRLGLRSARGLLVAGQIGLTALLLVAAGLLLRSLDNYRDIDLGYDTNGLLALHLPLTGEAYADTGRANRFFQDVVDRVRMLPGVESSAGVFLRPLWSTVGLSWPHQAEGQTIEEARANPLANLLAVTPGYFETMRIPLIAGRDFTSADREGAQGVVVVGQSFARRAWPDGDAIGRRLQMPLPDSPLSGEWLMVVGVVGDARYRAMDEPTLDVYMAAAQFPFTMRHVVVRAAGDPTALADDIRRAVLALDPDQPITDVRTMDAIVASALGARRLNTGVVAGFGLLAMGLAAIGLYAVLARIVEQRAAEIGLRLALGSTRPGVLRLVLGDGLRLAAVGLGAGLAVALITTRALASLLFGVAPADPATYAVAGALVLAVAMAASLLPAVRASRSDPVRALRQVE